MSAGIAGAALLAACAGPAEHRAGRGGSGNGQALGKVTGRLLLEGGALRAGGGQPGKRPIPGTVWFTAGGRRVSTVQVGASGEFSVALPPGRYAVSASSPRLIEMTSSGAREVPCARGVPAVVRGGRATTIAIACIVP